MLPESVESDLLGESKHGIFVTDDVFPCTEVPAILPVSL